MATATSPAPDDRSSKRQKGDENGSSSQGGDNMFPSRPPQHPSQMYPPGYMGMGGGGPYMGGAGMPPYPGQYGNPHGPPPPHYGGMYGGGGPPPPPVRGHGNSPERPGRPWNGGGGYRGPHSSSNGKKEMDTPNGPPQQQQQQQHAPNQHPYPPGAGWGHPQSWQPGHPPPPYGGPHPGYPGGSMPGMYSQQSGGGGGGAWGPNGGAHSPNEGGRMNTTNASVSSNKSPSRNRPRPESATPDPSRTQPPLPVRSDNASNALYFMDIGTTPTRCMSVTQDYGEEGSSVSGSTKDKGRGSYKCGRCGAPKKGHICPYQPKLKRRPDEPPPETRNAAVQVEMDEFMTLRRLNIRIQGFPESYATEPFMGPSMVGAEPHVEDAYLPPGSSHPHHGDGDMVVNMLPMEDIYSRPPPPQQRGPESNDVPLMEKDSTEPMAPSSSPQPKPETMDTATDVHDDGDPTEKEEKSAMV